MRQDFHNPERCMLKHILPVLMPLIAGRALSLPMLSLHSVPQWYHGVLHT